MTVIDVDNAKDTIVQTDYVGERLPHNVGDEVTLQLHGKEYLAVVEKHTYFKGVVCGGEIQYVIQKPNWKRVEL
jgi:hypothetical protein